MPTFLETSGKTRRPIDLIKKQRSIDLINKKQRSIDLIKGSGVALLMPRARVNEGVGTSDKTSPVCSLNNAENTNEIQ